MATPAERLTPTARNPFADRQSLGSASSGWIACAALLVLSLVLFRLNIH